MHTYRNTYFSPHEFMSGIFNADKKITPPKDVRIRAVILPHHLTANEVIASGVKMLQYQSFKKIVLISPDHFHQCKKAICTTNATYQTLFGAVSSDNKTVETLIASPIVSDNPNLFTGEHGIYADLPFIAHYFPGVPVTPLAISTEYLWKLKREEIKKLIGAIVDEETLLIVSSDFSHYLSLKKANEMDEKTTKIIFSKDFKGIESLHNSDQSDCPGCLWVLASLAKDRGFYNPEIVMHTNSATLLHDETIPSTTSHFSTVWYQEKE